ncbi:zinc ribbon domain-containing protein [Dinoroseobacter sp. S124A]|uniref:zinc ribbon domain-containing protein n=1 Tax=Dinoroseobacter sp. S124A TaxID=3415128 RepID=UPI003C7A8DC3
MRNKAAGHVQAKKWRVSLRRGHHEPLIGHATHEQILRNLKEGARPIARADFFPDFPLCGHVHCGACGNAMTGAWSKGKYKHYAYYRCETLGCSQKSKSIPQARLEGGFEDVLKSLQSTTLGRSGNRYIQRRLERIFGASNSGARRMGAAIESC